MLDTVLLCGYLGVARVFIMVAKALLGCSLYRVLWVDARVFIMVAGAFLGCSCKLLGDSLGVCVQGVVGGC